MRANTDPGPVIVVGGGIAGVACAQTLRTADVPVELVDRGHRLGGRMASRIRDGRAVDIGASYFTVGDDRFAAVVEGWRAVGLARPWTDTFSTLSTSGPPGRTSGPLRWGAGGGLRTLVEHLAGGLTTRQATVRVVDRDASGVLSVDGRPAAAVVLAMPDPQARRVLSPGLARLADTVDDPFEPVLALTAVWAERCWDPTFDAAFVTDDTLAWIADDGRRRGDGAPVLVAHSTPAVAAAHLDDPDAATTQLSAALVRLLAVRAPRTTEVHRWTFARPRAAREESYALDGLVGVCGDRWGGRPRVEAAYLSGRALGVELVERLR